MSRWNYTEEDILEIAAKRGLSKYPKLALRQEKLSRKAKEEPKFRFYNLITMVTLPDTLKCAWELVRANRGAAGVDHMTFDDIEQSEGGIEGFLFSIQKELKNKSYRASPVRRVYIEKANGKLRPLGIPIIKDRVVQMAVKLVIEPIFEADFHDCSYGFRPGRSARMAVECIAEEIKRGRKVIYDADLSSYFDTIPHDKLMLAVRKRIVDGSVLSLIRQWLKATIVESDGVKHNPHGKGTPQGGVISPLLSNIYLHWFETAVGMVAMATNQCARIVRYADDFVILAKEFAEGFVNGIERELEGRFGLVINREKTKCVNLDEKGAELNFLGYAFRQQPSIYSPKSTYLNYGPSKKSVNKIGARIKEITAKGNGFIPVEETVKKLNLAIDGWGRYFQCGHPSKMYQRVNWYASQRLMIWLKRRSQRGYRMKYASTFYGEARALGLVLLSCKRYRQ